MTGSSLYQTINPVPSPFDTAEQIQTVIDAGEAQLALIEAARLAAIEDVAETEGAKGDTGDTGPTGATGPAADNLLFESRAAAELATIPSVLDGGPGYLWVAGYDEPADGGHGHYGRVDEDPGILGFPRSDGGWWKLVPQNGAYNFLAIGGKGDWNGTTGTDNLPIFAAYCDAAPTYAGGYRSAPKLHVPRGAYYWSDGYELHTRVEVVGEDIGPNTPLGMTRFVYPRTAVAALIAGNGDTVGHQDAGGTLSTSFPSSFSGIVFEAIGIPQAGRVLEYNPTIQKLLCETFWTIQDGTEIDFYSILKFNFETAVEGTATVTGTVGDTQGCVILNSVSGFTDGEIITGGTSGQVGTVRFIGLWSKSLHLVSVSAPLTVGETVTGGSSGATAAVASVNFASTFRVLQLSDAAGVIDDRDYYGNRARRVFTKTGDHGIGLLARTTINLSDCSFINFGGHGVIMQAGAEGRAVGIADFCQLKRVTVAYVGGNAFSMGGSDGNINHLESCSAVLVAGAGVVDLSLLGNKIANQHTAHCLTDAVILASPYSTADFLYTEGSTVSAPYIDSGTWGRGATFSNNGFISGTIRGFRNEPPPTIFLPGNFRSNGFTHRVTNEGAADSGLLSLKSAGGGVTTALRATKGGVFGPDQGVSLDFHAAYLGPEGVLSGQVVSGGLYTTQAPGFVGLRAVPAFPPYATFSGAPTVTPVVTFSVVGGAIVSAEILDRGVGCPDGMTLTVTANGAGSGATATCVVRDGEVESVTITAGGSGYNNTAPVEGLRVFAKGISVPNTVSATTLGSVARKMEIFAADGSSLGFIPIYSSIS